MKLRVEKIVKFDPLHLLIIILLFYDTLINFVTAILYRLPLIGTIGGFIVPGIVVVLFVYCIFVNHTIRICAPELIVILALSLLLALSYLLFPENQQFYNSNNLKNIFLGAFPFLLLGSNFDEGDAFFKWLIRLSSFAIVVNVLYLSFYLSNRTMSNDNMHWAYLLVPHVLLVIKGTFDKEKLIIRIVRIIVSIVGTLYVLSMGTRGPILIIIIYFGILIFLKLIQAGWKKALVPILIVGGLIVFILSDSYMGVILQIRDYFSKAGLSVRSIDLFLNGEYISYQSGRDVIYATLWEKVYERPILGYGIFGEWQFIGYTAHNIYLQLCVHFGILIGSTLAAWYLITVGKGYFLSTSKAGRDLILLYFVFTFVRGIFGGDYLSSYFFFLLGLSLQQIRLSKGRQNHIVKFGHYCEE